MAMLPGVTTMMPDFTQGFIKRDHEAQSENNRNIKDKGWVLFALPTSDILK
jgi:hypothetical protein